MNPSASQEHRPSELLFLAPGDVRKARVEPISWMRTCEAFTSRGLKVTLVTLRGRYPDAVRTDAVWEHFGVAPSFRIRILPTPLRRDSSTRAFRAWGGMACSILAAVVLGGLLVRRRRLTVYARSPVLLAPFALLRGLLPRTRRPGLVYETHALPAASTWRMVRRADLIVVNSRKLEGDVRTAIGVPPERILYAPLPPFAHVHRRPKHEARSELGLPGDVPIACYTGKMLHGQCELLFDVADRLSSRVPGFRMLLVGGNPDILERMRRDLTKRSLAGTVILTGFVDPTRVSLYQSAADVLVFHMDSDLPHFDYCTPAKALDYQAVGRPIVARDIPLFEEVFGTDGERAIKVGRPAPEEFALAIEEALSLKDGGTAMTKRAMSWIASRSWQARVDAVLKALPR